MQSLALQQYLVAVLDNAIKIDTEMATIHERITTVS